jgi:hypothetical protein
MKYLSVENIKKRRRRRRKRGTLGFTVIIREIMD